MKAKYFLSVAAVFLAACSEPTSPVDFDVAAGKQTTPPPPTATLIYSENFESGVASLGPWNMNVLATSTGSTRTSFLGRLGNEELSLSVPAGKSSVTITFDLYIIGSWDGIGLQGFGSDRWQIEVSKNGGARENVFHTSFSNQATKNQNFPRQIDGGSSPNDRGAVATNTLGYPKGAGKYDVGDAVYHLTYTVSNPGAGPLVFYLHTTTPLQSLNDESWGLDNVSVSGN